MKNKSSRYWILGLLVTALGAGILTFTYSQWYSMIRAALILPLILSLFLPAFSGRLLRAVFGGIGSAGFGFFVCLWSVYPFGRAFPGIWEKAPLGAEIGILAVFTFLFVLRSSGILKSPVPLIAAGIPILVLLAGLLVYHGFLQPAGIAVEFCSYLPYYTALVLMGAKAEG